MPKKARGKRPQQITADMGKKLLLQAGYELIRSGGGHRIFKRGDDVITMPSSGYCAAWLTQMVYRAVEPSE